MEDLEGLVGKPHEDDKGIDYELYCFKIKQEGLKYEEYRSAWALRLKAGWKGLSILSDSWGANYWVGCLPDEKEKYKVVDEFFEKFKQVENCVYNEPEVRTATWDGLAINTFKEVNPNFKED